jgi:SHS2 domain-containing protein
MTILKKVSMEKKFRFLEHTADMYIESEGKNLETAFSNVAIGLGFMIVTSDNVAKKVEKKIKVEAEDKQALLFDFLSKFLIFQDADSLIFHDVKVEKIEEKKGRLKLIASAWGEKFNSKKHDEGTHVKAITYHHMDIRKEKDKYVVKVLVDI